ncbi:hypothetical protein [Streptosporangium subroseum]|uniref:hypothetical protein n=1 Tax=Streptosporangium subroseum TaxID=106412 RepID=UPI0030868728|nr:hypothetical protein OHB15_05330 [Streptosporangium subroseum]
MSAQEDNQPRTLYEIACAYLNGEIPLPYFEDSTPKVRAVILDFVPEAQGIIRELEQEAEHYDSVVTLWSYVRSLAEVLFPSLEEGKSDLIRRCLLAAEELLGYSSLCVREFVEEQAVEDFDYLLVNVRELCGPRVLAILERRAS